MEKREKLILFFSLSLIACAGMLYLLLPAIVNKIKPSNPNYIGLSIQTKGDVKIRFSNSIIWRKLDKEDKIFANSYIFTGPDSTSRFAFLDRSVIELEPNSMVSLDFQALARDGKVSTTEQGFPQIKIGVVGGKVDLKLRPDSQVKSVKMDNTSIEVGGGKSILLEVSSSDVEEVSVMDGDVMLTARGQSQQVSSGEKAINDPKDANIKRQEIHPEVLAEMRRLSDQSNKLWMEEEKKKREFFYLMKSWYNSLFNSDETAD